MSPPKEPKPVDPGVLAGLSRTRPQRRSTKRSPREGEAATETPPATGASAAVGSAAARSDAPVADAVKAARKGGTSAAAKAGKPAKSTSKSKTKTAKAKGASSDSAAPKAAKAKPKAASAKPKAAKAGPPAGKAKTETATSGAAKPARPRKTETTAAKPAPAATDEQVPPAGYATPEREGPPSGVELVATALQAAGEVGRLGGAAVRGLLSKLPKP